MHIVIQTVAGRRWVATSVVASCQQPDPGEQVQDRD